MRLMRKVSTKRISNLLKGVKVASDWIEILNPGSLTPESDILTMAGI